MAIRRQAPKLSVEDYAVYVEDLMPYPVEDVEAACLQIGRTERGEGETAMPCIAAVLDVVKRFARERRERAEKQAWDDYVRDFKESEEMQHELIKMEQTFVAKRSM